MKKILFLACLFLSVIQLVNGQKLDTAMYTSPQALHDKYMQNRAVQNTVGWVVLGCGLGMTAGGIYVYFIQAIGEGDVSSAGPTLFYLGVASSLASIPFFISAGQYKKKAQLALKKESITFGNKAPNRTGYMALALTIRF